MEGARKILIDVRGPSMNSDALDDLSYPDLLNRIFSLKGDAKFTGLAPVGKFKLIEHNNLHVSYEVVIDNLTYPKVKDYADKLKTALAQTLKEFKIEYSVSEIDLLDSLMEEGKKMDSIVFTLDYAEGYAELSENLSTAQQLYTDDLIEQYKRGDKATRTAILNQYPDLIDIINARGGIESQQKVSTSPSTFSPEEEMKRRAIEPETSAIEPQTTVQAPDVSKINVIPPSATAPIIVSPSEKTTIREKENKDMKSFVETISNMVFDKRIMNYDKSLIKTSDVYNTSSSEKISSSPVPFSQKTVENNTLKEKATTTKQGNTISSALESFLGPNVVLVPFQIPSETQSIQNNQVSTETSNNVERQIKETTVRDESRENDIISSLTNSLRQTEGMIGQFSNILQSNQKESNFGVNNIVNDTFSFLGLTPATISSSVEKLKDVAVMTEKSASQNNVLQDMTNRVVGTDVIAPLKGEITSMVENIGNSIKTAITSINIQDKKAVEERPSSSPTTVVQSPSVSPVSNNSENSEMNLQSPTIQSLSTGGNIPAIVSLSQSTIDNLASAIIKNMSISSFLNSGA